MPGLSPDSVIRQYCARSCSPPSRRSASGCPGTRCGIARRRMNAGSLSEGSPSEGSRGLLRRCAAAWGIFYGIARLGAILERTDRRACPADIRCHRSVTSRLIPDKPVGNASVATTDLPTVLGARVIVLGTGAKLHPSSPTWTIFARTVRIVSFIRPSSRRLFTRCRSRRPGSVAFHSVPERRPIHRTVEGILDRWGEIAGARPERKRSRIRRGPVVSAATSFRRTHSAGLCDRFAACGPLGVGQDQIGVIGQPQDCLA